MKISRKFGWALAVVVLTVTFALGMAIPYIIAEKGIHLKLSNKHLGFEVEISPEKDISTLLEEALKNDSEGTNAILEAKNYFNLSSDALMDKIAKIDLTDKTGKKISNDLQKMLANLQGPFQLPNTFKYADERLMKAFDALDKAMIETKVASVFLAELWEQNLEQDGIFRQRKFAAEVELIEHGDGQGPKIYGCPGGVIKQGRAVDIFVKEFNTGVGGAVYHDIKRLNCDGDVVTASGLLKGNAPVRFGLNRAAFNILFPGDREHGDEEVRQAEFLVYPRHLAPSFQSGD